MIIIIILVGPAEPEATQANAKQTTERRRKKPQKDEAVQTCDGIPLPGEMPRHMQVEGSNFTTRNASRESRSGKPPWEIGIQSELWAKEPKRATPLYNTYIHLQYRSYT